MTPTVNVSSDSFRLFKMPGFGLGFAASSTIFGNFPSVKASRGFWIRSQNSQAVVARVKESKRKNIVFRLPAIFKSATLHQRTNAQESFKKARGVPGREALRASNDPINRNLLASVPLNGYWGPEYNSLITPSYLRLKYFRFTFIEGV